MLFCCYLINISKMNTSSDNEQESQEVLLTSNTNKTNSNTNAVVPSNNSNYIIENLASNIQNGSINYLGVIINKY